MITTTLRILLVEDLDSDAELIMRYIKRIAEDPIFRVVDDLIAFKDALINFSPDIIISDYNLPTCTGLEVLQLATSIDDSIPFIFLTGTIEDEELAVNTILTSTFGFILKKNMNELDVHLKPLLKKAVFNMQKDDHLREQIRENKIAVRQIYSYLEELNADNEQQNESIIRLKSSIMDLKNKENDKK